MSVKRRKISCKMAKYCENQHIMTVGLPANLNFVQKNSPATVKVNFCRGIKGIDRLRARARGIERTNCLRARGIERTN